MDKLKEAKAYLDRVCESLINKNRFVVDKEFQTYLEKILNENKREIAANSVFFRARNYTDQEVDPSKLGTQYEGYDAKNSFVNITSKWPSQGRMNPQGITVLYLASDERTAITELHPYVDEVISLATIENFENLSISDLSQSSSAMKDDFERSLSILIQKRLSKGNGDADYVFPQFVAAFCQSLGYDGIGFKSKYATKASINDNMGINYTIFNYNKCSVTGSKLKKIGTITVKISPYT